MTSTFSPHCKNHSAQKMDKLPGGYLLMPNDREDGGAAIDANKFRDVPLVSVYQCPVCGYTELYNSAKGL